MHFELGSHQLLEYHIKSTYRYLLGMAKLYRSEKMILEYFRKDAPKIVNERTLIASLKKLHDGLKKLSTDPFESPMLKELDLLSWLESRMQRRPLPDILREKAQGKLTRQVS